MFGDVVDALHHGRVFDEVGESLVVGPAGELDVAGSFEAGTIARLGVAQIVAAFIVPAGSQFFLVPPATGFMGRLAEEMAESRFRGDVKFVQTGVEFNNFLILDQGRTANPDARQLLLADQAGPIPGGLGWGGWGGVRYCWTQAAWSSIKAGSTALAKAFIASMWLALSLWKKVMKSRNFSGEILAMVGKMKGERGSPLISEFGG